MNGAAANRNNNDFTPLTPYETSQISLIRDWKNQEPWVISKTFGIVVSPLSWVVRNLIPEAVIRGVLDGANAVSQYFADCNDIKRDGQVNSIKELRTKDLQLSDKLANEVHNWAIGLAAAEGVGTGLIGLPGMVADIPAIITIALRTIHKIALCYGYEVETKEDKDFILGILAASGANTVKEKISALYTLRTIEVMIARTTKRKALQAIPAIGLLIGCSANAWYIKEVGWAARRAYQERWLIDNHKIIDI
ncbi:cation-transporting ATPase, E1-E2 family [Thermosinus carboxydivorans Nor1]|uniref:Cation-transporting ATPase, E1-E2 family n=1 Tax=Thermosinus carboxydivorans Nor1 TaxID=401526 RepID=A1HQI8_9FIRM|nr:EcsC family protein [Thermosinus carboxydivorans]EAX47806.1 cation-transporting ATPase, E1-E2 family [Thermosinus carboxydivorans Nor1]